jgi:pyrroloquinoline quinone biosynthesis protein E
MSQKNRFPFRNLVVEVTEKCNNACLHCCNYWRGNGARAQDMLSRQEIREVVGKVLRDAPLIQVALSGGEPLLRADLPEICCDLVGMGLGTVVITNGVLLDGGRLRRFPADTAFEITLFSADEHLHNQIAGRVVFDRILENIVRLRRRGHRFVLVFVITRLNAQDTTRTIKLGVALGAEAVMMNRINLSKRTISSAKELVPTRAQLAESLGAAEALAAEYGIPIAVSVPIPPCVVDPREFPHLHFGWCPRGGENAYYTVGCTGLLRPCNHSSVILGDLRKERFAEAALNRKAREFWRPVPQECLECRHPLKEQCRGGCPAAADECYGSRLRVDPFVRLLRSELPA